MNQLINMTLGEILGLQVLLATKSTVHSSLETSETQAYFIPTTSTLIMFMKCIELPLFFFNIFNMFWLWS